MPDKPERSHTILPTRDDASAAPVASCFVGSTLVDTTSGRMTIADLATLSEQRDQQTEMFARHIAHLQAFRDRQLEAFDATATVLLTSANERGSTLLQSALLTQREALAEDVTKAIADANDACIAHLADMLPRVLAYDTATGDLVERSIVKAWAPRAATEFVDVTVGTHKIRCTPEHVFITPDGDVEAQALEGGTVYQMVDDGEVRAQAHRVSKVEHVEVVCPVVVFDLEVEGVTSYCVSSDSSAPSVVVGGPHA